MMRPWRRARTRRPIYHRALRLRHLRPGRVATFMLFEGAILVAVLLALAELVDWAGVAVVPVAVAVVVKLNDVVAGVLRRPVAIAQLSRGRVAGATAIGWSPRQSPSRPTSWFTTDDAVADPRARPDEPAGPPVIPSVPRPGPPPRDGVIRGIASVPHPGRAIPSQPEYPQQAHFRTRGNQGRFAS